NIVFGVVSADGTQQLPTLTKATLAQHGAESVLETIVEGIERVVEDARKSHGIRREEFAGVGVGAPGPLDRAKGLVIVAPNLHWHNFPLRDRVAGGVGLKVTLDNDANCATLGEWWLGAGRGSKIMLGLTIGTGIGGGLIIDGKLFHGASDVAGEVGHTTIETQGRRCACGNYGCLEAYASGTAIAERAREAFATSDSPIIRELAKGDPEQITAQTVFVAATRGDALALEVVRDTAKFLGTGVANLLNLFNPEVVVLMGGVTAAGNTLFDPLLAEVRRRAFRPAWEGTRILPGTLPGSAGVVGAVATFLHQHPIA
ncbi:MAG TPA: ROK family protein, partial [Gemmatimonadaceae bacterium]|nr:ROK family protein [Gemmatimonadaceae bacterium]